LRIGLSPEINATATVIVLVSLVAVLVSNRLSKQATLGG
jgi:ABC-type spermidine/putrescine transport system permease subunit II